MRHPIPYLLLLVLLICNQLKGQQLSPPSNRSALWKYYWQFFKETSDPVNGKKECEPLRGVREADVLWSKLVYRDIEIGPRINRAFFEKTDTTSQAVTLFDAIKQAYHIGEIVPFNGLIDPEGEFVQALFPEQCDSICFRYASFSGDSISYALIAPENIVGWRLKEYWYFDQAIGKDQVRIIGVMPLASVLNRYGDREAKATAWFYYPEIRYVFCATAIGSSTNEGRLSFDDLFQHRRFQSVIVDEGDVFDRSDVEAGYRGYNLLQESERIRSKLHNQEMDLWEY